MSKENMSKESIKEKKDKIEENIKGKIEEWTSAGKIDDVIEALVNEKDKLEREIKKDYRSARRYVRAHPEQGVGASFLGGLLLGFVIAKLLDR